MARTYYEVLQVPQDATDEQIKEAYRTMAWQSQSAGGQEAMKEINEAYAVLSNPERRAAYDAALADGTATVPTKAPAAASGSPAAPAIGDEAFQAEGPGFHPFYRLLSIPFEFAYTISRARYLFIPFNLILGIAALIGLVTSANGYLSAPANQVMHAVSVGQVISGTPYSFVSITGNLVRDYRITASSNGNVTAKYTAVVSGKDILFVKGDNPPDKGPYVGVLKGFSSDLQSMVQEDSRNPKLPAGTRFATQQYLDTTDRPQKPYAYLLGIIASVVAVVVLLVPLLFGYVLFRPRRGERLDSPATGPAWPIRVTAHGPFRPEGNGRHHTERFMPATLIRTGNPEQPLEVRYVVFNRRGTDTAQVLAIPAGSQVEWGYLYGSGKPKPTLSFRFGRQKARLSVPTEAHARWIAEAFAVGSL